MSLTENALLSARVREWLDLHGFLKLDSTENFARAIINKFDVRTTGPDQAARSLSGGNLQKFVIGREVMQRPRVLVVNQPTWGVDAAAAAAIRESLRDLADEGSAILVVSQDLDELMELADTIAILADGRLSEPAPIGSVSIEAIGEMMEGKMEAARVQA
jgi:simple sugar transport system ATP-binding protein